MTDDVNNAVCAKLEHIETYFEVTPDMEGELQDFGRRLVEFAEYFSNAAAFENAFAQDALYQEYCAFFTKLKPRAYKMTAEDKQRSRQIAKDMFREDRKEIIADALQDAAETGMVYAKGQALKQRRERMIANDTFDDYTRATNRVDNAARTGGFIKKLFKK